MRYKIETYNHKDQTTSSAEEVARYRLNETSYHCGHVEGIDEKVTNINRFLPELVGILEERGILTPEDICKIFLVKAIVADP